jgi:hypothetical protein
MTVLFWVVLILFSIVKTKIVHYSSLCYFPLSFLAAYVAHKLMRGEMKWKKSTGVLLMAIASLIGIAISILPIVNKYKEQLIASNLIKDKFAIENLKAPVYWSGAEWLLGLLLIGGIAAMLLLIKQGKMKTGIIGIFITGLITVNLSSILIVPRIEKYSQAAAIEFYEYLQGKDCYVETIGFKSYAQLFYSHKQPPANSNSFNSDWLLKGDIDKKAYFVSKITSLQDIRKEFPELIELYSKNGFVFWVRNPKR